MVEVFVHSCTPLVRSKGTEKRVGMLGAVRFTAPLKLTHALPQPLTFSVKITGTDPQLFGRGAVSGHRLFVGEQVAKPRAEDSSKQGPLRNELAGGHL